MVRFESAYVLNSVQTLSESKPPQTHTIIEEFLYDAKSGNKSHHRKDAEYGAKWGADEGDIIECELNLETMALSFIVNHANQGIAFNLNKNKTYHFVFFFRNKNDSFTVISETIEKTMPSLVLF